MKAKLLQPETRPLAERLISPFQEFVHAETSGGILLLVCTLLALVWANSPWASLYNHLWETRFSVGLSYFVLDKSLHMWINDGLMALFFLLVGLEIKRELLVGELSTPRQAALPLIAAVGGAIVPALIYIGFTWGSRAFDGWGVPMATDISFALGILVILGRRLPLALRIFLTALAIFDDLIAVLVIAIFYSHGLHWPALAAAGACLCWLAICNLIGVRKVWIYVLFGLALWLALFLSGVHATIAGILLALTIPTRARIDASAFLSQSREELDAFAGCSAPGVGLYISEQQQAALQTLKMGIEKVQAPLLRMERVLHLPVAFLIVPLFILSNAGVSLQGVGGSLFSPVSLGIALGLIIGKPLGITFFCWLAIKLGLADLPRQVTFRSLYALSWLGGIGFTMSLFVADLAFDGQEPTFLREAKVGILLALLVSGVGGFLLLYWLGGARSEPSQPAPEGT